MQHEKSNQGLYWDFPGGPVVKNLPVNAMDTSLIPSAGRWDTGQLSPKAATNKPIPRAHAQPRQHSKKAHSAAPHTQQPEGSPHTR